MPKIPLTAILDCSMYGSANSLSCSGGIIMAHLKMICLIQLKRSATWQMQLWYALMH